MRQQHHVVMLATTSWPTSPGEIAALANPEHTAQAMDGKFRFGPIDEREAHRLPSRTKKAVAFFRMSRSCRRISFSRRSRFSSAVTSLAAADGSTACRSRLRPTQRTSVDSPIPRSPAISRWVRPLVCARRTASCSNSFVNRRCCVIEFLIAHRELSTFPKQVQVAFYDQRARRSNGSDKARGTIKCTRLSCRIFATKPFASNSMCWPLTWAILCVRWHCPRRAEPWSLTSLRGKLIKIGVKVVRHECY